VRSLTTPESFVSQQDYDSAVASGFVDPYVWVQNDAGLIAAWDAYSAASLAFFSAYWAGNVTQAIDEARNAAEEQWYLYTTSIGATIAQGYLAAGVTSASDVSINENLYGNLHEQVFEPLQKGASQKDSIVLSATSAFGWGVRGRLAKAARDSSGVFNEAPVVSFGPTAADTTVIQGSATPDFMAGVTVADDSDGVIDPSNVTVDQGGFDVNVPGTYQVSYSVSDSEGATSTTERSFDVTPDVSLITAALIPTVTFSNIGDTIDIIGGQVDFPFDPSLVYDANGNGDRYWLVLRTKFYAPDGNARNGGTSRYYGSYYWQEDAGNGTWFANVDSVGMTPYGSDFDTWDIADGDTFTATLTWERYNTLNGVTQILVEKTTDLVVTGTGYTQPDVSAYTSDIGLKANRNMTENNGVVSLDLPWTLSNGRSPVGLFDANQTIPAGSRYSEITMSLYTTTKVYRNGVKIDWAGNNHSDDYYAYSGGEYAGSTYWVQDGDNHTMGNLWNDVKTFNFKDGNGDYLYGTQSGDDVVNTYHVFVRYYDDQGNYVESEWIDMGVTDSVVLS